MKKQRILILMLLFAAYSTGYGQGLSGTAAAFVDVGIGARPLAMGGAYTALTQDASAVFWNPAGLASLNGRATEFSHVNQFGIIPYNAFSGAISFLDYHALGLGVLASGDTQLRETTMLLTYALNGDGLFPGLLSRLQLGFSLKYQYASYGQSEFDPSAYPLFSEQDVLNAQNAFSSGTASGLGFDLGLGYRLTERVQLGMTWRNIANTISWQSNSENYDESIPSRMVFGLAFRANRELTVSVDFDNSLAAGSPNRLRVGTEKRMFNYFALRGGIGQTLAANSSRDYAVGMGLYKRISGAMKTRLDYAFQMHAIANTHRFSFQLEF